MAPQTGQVRLSAEQIEAFYHANFVVEQAHDFRDMIGPPDGSLVLDLGGGCGYFAQLLARGGYPVRVMDMDPRSVEACLESGLDARLGDALDPRPSGDEKIVSLNLILHHLVGSNERETCALQMQALKSWHDRGVRLFVNEYIYQSVVGQISPRLIYEITSSRVLSLLGRVASKAIPSFRANTFGVGVRFRSHEQWLKIFAEAGFKVVGVRIGEPEPIALPLRALLIRAIRRDSFLLESR